MVLLNCMKEEKVVLVDQFDNPIGTMPKMEAHEKAVLHRAFSVFILNKKGELMLQKEPCTNTILLACGRIPVVVINVRERYSRCGPTKTERRNGFFRSSSSFISFYLQSPF